MGLRGRPPTPTKLKILRGNPGHRPLNKLEPQPAVRRPKRPRWLTREARRQWGELAGVLERMGVLTEADGVALAMLSTSVALVAACVEAMVENGAASETASGYCQRRPESAMLIESMSMAKAWAREFGLTPASRSQLQVDRSEPRDELDALLG